MIRIQSAWHRTLVVCIQLQQVKLRLSVLGCLLLVSLLWQFTAPIPGYLSCGLIIPHEHILLGRADGQDLAQHIAAESNCANGQPDAPDIQSTKLYGSKGIILNEPQFQRNQTPFPTFLYLVVAILPTVIVLMDNQSFFSRLAQIRRSDQSIVLTPPKPPPKAILSYSL